MLRDDDARRVRRHVHEHVLDGLGAAGGDVGGHANNDRPIGALEKQLTKPNELNAGKSIPLVGGEDGREKVGKEAIAADCATAICGMSIKLNAKVMAVTLPSGCPRAMTVFTMKFNCTTATPSKRGPINLKTFSTA